MNSSDSAEAYIVRRYKLWQRWAPHYDYKHVKGARIAEIIAETGGPVDTALEIGVGPGGIAAALSRRGTKVVGIDLSPHALALAQEHCESERVSLIRASGFFLPFRTASLRLVYASQVLHLFESDARLTLMREVHRVLAPGGLFLFDMKNPWSHPLRFLKSPSARRRRNFPSKVEIVQALGTAGFTSVATRPGVLPFFWLARVPNVGLFRVLAHTTFFLSQTLQTSIERQPDPVS
ncbi:MAG: class I SAM-dependent methyltransferase [Acidobacteriota bacterium]